MTSFELLFSRSVASSLLKQQNLGNFLGQHSWNLNLDSGRVDFGGGRIYPIQIIGTEAEDSHTWLWAWANEASGIPPHLLECANKLHAHGISQDIEELRQAELDLDLVNGHMMAMIATALCSADAYYRGPYEGGAVFFTLRETPLPSMEPAEPMELIQILSSCITQYPVHHKVMVQSLFEQQGYDVDESGGQFIATSPAGKIVAINFDQSERIEGMETTVSGEGIAGAKPRLRFNE